MTGSPLQQRFGLTVTPQNVLGVRAVVLQEAQDLDTKLNIEREQLFLPALGGDLVSADMSAAFNEITGQLLARAKQHIDDLFKLGEELGVAAQTYGHTEGDVEASFKSGVSRTAASQLPPTMGQVVGMGSSATRPSPRSLGALLTGGLA